MERLDDTSPDQAAPTDEVLFTVTDLKQYSFCPRVFYYEHCLPRVRPRTHKMDIGRDEHEEEQKRADRRTLRQYGDVTGRREFEVQIESRDLRLRGIVDEVVHTDDGRLLPVDYKLATVVSTNHRLQLAAYAMLLESSAGVAVSEGYIYLIGKRSMTRVHITAALREQIRGMIGGMFETLRWERQPKPTAVRNRCVGCEFRRFCNDV